jgi:cardiolipin synthase A/B
MTYASSRRVEQGPQALPAGGAEARSRRPASRLWRRFLVPTVERLLTALLVACATPPAAVDMASAPAAPARVADAKGELPQREADAVVRRLERASDGKGLARQVADTAAEAPLTLGNEARLLVDGPQTHAAMFKAISAARREIHLETYIIDPGEVSERLAALLSAKRAQGVEVKVLHDAVGSSSTPAEFFQRLTAAGIAVCEFNPINPLKAQAGWQINNRDHRKLLIVDDSVAFTGGVNISSVYLAGSFSGRRKAPTRQEGWRDTHVQVRGPVVAEFERLFAASWESQNCSPRMTGKEVLPAKAGNQAMRVVAADPSAGQSEFYGMLLSAINGARSRVWLTYGYFVPDQRMLDALEIAARHGVDVRLVLPGFSDFWATFHAGRSRYDELLEAGVHIFERRDALLHAKTAVIDGTWSSIGSTNLDWRSFVHNYEADVVVLDPGFGAEMEDLFRLDEKASHEVTLEEWRRRDIGTRFKEWLARRWEYLL